ncbi:MAG: toll/interleukin-1 receptor domain-containing protein [bacterium]
MFEFPLDGLKREIVMNGWDVFVLYATEDKEAFVRDLVEALVANELQVWYVPLKFGDSLMRSIEKGLSSCHHGVVVLSPAFFSRDWPQKELDALVQPETKEQKAILPIWHNIDRDEIAKYSLLLADRVAVKSYEGLEAVVNKILDVVRPRPYRADTGTQGIGQTRTAPQPD